MVNKYTISYYYEFIMRKIYFGDTKEWKEQ